MKFMIFCYSLENPRFITDSRTCSKLYICSSFAFYCRTVYIYRDVTFTELVTVDDIDKSFTMNILEMLISVLIAEVYHITGI